MKKPALLLSSCIWLAAAAAFGQSEFNVVPATEAMLEGGSVNILVVQTDKEHFTLRVPRKYSVQVHQSDQRIVFTAEAGSCVITLKMSTNFAGGLPKMESLRDQVARKYSSASLVQTWPCYTSFGQGFLFDLFQPAAGDMTLRMRDAYVAFAGGSFEFTLSCDLREYDTHRLEFASLLNSFRLQAQPAMKNP